MDDIANKRKVRTSDGKVGCVMVQLTKQFASVQWQRDGYYKVYDVADLEDITDEEFKRRFR